MNQDFFTISPEQCKETIPIIRKNATDHYNLAELLAKETYYGSAVAHLILSSEELVKALIITVASRGYNIRQVAGIKKFFYRHRPRHEVASMMAIMVPLFPFIQKFMELGNFVTVKDENIEIEVNKNGEPSKEALMKLTDSLEIKPLGQEEDIKKMFELLQSIELPEQDLYGKRYEFWKQADLTKQAGFYVDFKGAIKSPDMFTPSKYEEAFDCVQSFNNSIIAIMDGFEDVPKFIIDIVLSKIMENPEIFKEFESSIIDLGKE